MDFRDGSFVEKCLDLEVLASIRFGFPGSAPGFLVESHGQMGLVGPSDPKMAPKIQCMLLCHVSLEPVAPCLSLSLEMSRLRPIQTSIDSDRSTLILDLGTGVDKSWPGTHDHWRFC